MNALRVLLIFCLILYLAIYHSRFWYYYFLLLIPYYLISQFIYNDKTLVTPKKKGFLSMWQHPSDPQCYGTLKFNITKLERLLDEYSKKVGVKIGLTEFFVKLMAEMIKKFTFLNGNILFGKFIPRPSVDMSLQVNVNEGKGYELITLRNVDQMSLADIKKNIDTMKDDLENGRDAHHNRRMLLARCLQSL
jgi:hypothetical protein